MQMGMRNQVLCTSASQCLSMPPGQTPRWRYYTKLTMYHDRLRSRLETWSWALALFYINELGMRQKQNKVGLTFVQATSLVSLSVQFQIDWSVWLGSAPEEQAIEALEIQPMTTGQNSWDRTLMATWPLVSWTTVGFSVRPRLRTS